LKRSLRGVFFGINDFHIEGVVSRDFGKVIVTLTIDVSVNNKVGIVTQKSGSTEKEEEGGITLSLVARAFHHFQLL